MSRRRHTALRARRPAAVAAAVGSVLAMVLTGACVSKNEIGGSNNPTPTTTTIPPEFGSLGTDVAYEGVLATVVDVAAFDQSPTGTPRLRVVMRVENVSDSVQRNPDLQLLCDETPNTGDWFLGSTWEPNVLLPVNAVSQGEVIIGFPLKGDNPEYPVVKCTSPRLRLTVIDARAALPKVVDIVVDDAIITQAIRRPRGPNLPLPPRGS